MRDQLRRTGRSAAVKTRQTRDGEVHFRLRAGEKERFELAVEKARADSLSSLIRRLLHTEADRLGIAR